MQAALGGARADHVEGVAAGADVAAQRGALAIARLALDHAPPPHRLVHLLQPARFAHPHLPQATQASHLPLHDPDRLAGCITQCGQQRQDWLAALHSDS